MLGDQAHGVVMLQSSVLLWDAQGVQVPCGHLAARTALPLILAFPGSNKLCYEIVV